MIINKKIFFLIYTTLYLTLLAGLYLNEDFGGGFVQDYNLHLDLINNLFNESIIYGLINYDIFYVPHSPLFILYMILIKKIFISEFLFRLFNLHLSLLIPFFTYLAIKTKYKLRNYDLRLLLPTIFFLSPFFRAGSIWVDDNIFALIFLTIGIFFFTKEFVNKTTSLKYILATIIFLALAAYFRPIYSILSIYFFIIFFSKLKVFKNLVIYVTLNLVLAFPAFYYVFILEINKWATGYLFRVNFFTFSSIVITIMVFYILPFVFYEYKKLLKKIFNFNIILISIVYFFLLNYFFYYDLEYSGGIFLKSSQLFFNNNYFFYIVSAFCLSLLYFIFIDNPSYKDLVLILLLIILEIDGVIYHETYDPLLIILILLLFENKYILNFFNKLDFKYFLFIFIYFLAFLITSIIKINFL